ALEHTPGEVEFGLMARAEKAAEPVVAEIGRRELRPERRRAAEMRADADRHPQVRLDRARLVLAVVRLLRDIRLRVGDAVVALRERVDHRLRAVQEPARLAAPFDVDLLAGLDLADVDLDRSARGLRPLARPQ